VLLAKGGKLQFASGLFDDVADLPLFFEQYSADLASDAKLLFFVVNLPNDAKIVLSGYECQLVSLAEGIVWNALCEYLYLEKSDFKGQGSGEKIKRLPMQLLAARAAMPLPIWIPCWPVVPMPSV